MDVLLAAARSLASGDPLGALKLVALRDDAQSLALHGIAMAQLGDLARSSELLARAVRELGPGEPVARARCVIACAEVAVAARDIACGRTAARAKGDGGDDLSLAAAIATLAARGDRANALHGQLVAVRHQLLLGQIDLAEHALAAIDLTGAPARLVASGELVAATIALRRLRTRMARACLERAREAAMRAGIPALVAEIDTTRAALEAPAARAIIAGVARPVRLDEVEAMLASDDLVVDACRRTVGDQRWTAQLARRPVLFALARALAEAWPGDASREALLASAFDGRRPNESHRARLRVQIGRLRRELAPIADVEATALGFTLTPQRARSVAVLVPPIDGEDAALLALLADGEAWSTPGLALALGRSERSVQRALSALEASARVQSRGSARARRWLAPPVAGFTTLLMLPTALPIG